jgi:hypothetical protein
LKNTLASKAPRSQVVERRGDGELVVAVGRGWSHGAGEVDHPIDVRLVSVETRVVTVGAVTVGLEDLLGQRQLANEL